MRIAVTGGMGFIGTEIVKVALANKVEVICVDFMKDLIPFYEGERFPILDDVYSNLSRCMRTVEPWDFAVDVAKFSPQVIIHAGAVVDTKDLGTSRLVERNVRYTELLAEGADRSGAHIVFTSSAAVYGAAPRRHPINPYALTKAMGENVLKQLRVRTVALRLFNVFGRNEHHKGEMASVPFKLAQAYRSGDRFDLHSPDARRDFVPVSTVARVVVERATELGPKLMGTEHQTFDVGTGHATSFDDLDNFIMQATGNTSRITREVPMPKELEGRYQGYTCAGSNGNIVLGTSVPTRKGLEEMYGQGDRQRA